MDHHFQMLAAYNKWANEQIFEAVSPLSESQYRQDAGLYFKSIQATLNHLLNVDLLWMKRFTGEGDHPDNINTILHLNLSDLHIARQQLDLRICAWLSGLSPANLSGRFVFLNMKDMRTISQRLAPALAHMFNHQTQHRGQVHAALTMLLQEAPCLDLIAFHKTEFGRSYA